MHTLALQQRQLAAAIVERAPATGLGEGWVVGAPVGGRAGIEVYRHAYRARLIEALRSNYPVLHRVLGDDAFAELALAYLQAQPSRAPSIRWFGDHLVPYLAAAPDRVAHPSLVDLARMEWGLGLSFDCADALVLTPDDLTQVPPAQWADLRFLHHPSVLLLPMAWAIEPAWTAVTADESAQMPAPDVLPHRLLVWRLALDTRWRSLADDEAMLLQACLEGERFGRLCERAVAVVGEQRAAAFAAGLLRRWVEDGLLSGLSGLEPQPGPPDAQSA